MSAASDFYESEGARKGDERMEERMLEAEFSTAWKSLRDDQKRAIVRDVREVQAKTGLAERPAIRLLVKRIGGLNNLYDYADVLIIRPAVPVNDQREVGS